MRNKTIVKKVMERDLGICVACGMMGSEVHHILPLTFGGKDEMKNMCVLCSICHKSAPDNEKDFKEYRRRGGQGLREFYGLVVDMWKNDNKQNIPFPVFLNFAKQVFNWVCSINYSKAIEKYNIKKSINYTTDTFRNEIEKSVTLE